MAAIHAHPDPPSFFLTPPPRHLAELRIDPAPSAVAFSAPCAAARKRRCLLPSSARKRMLLELSPFDLKPEPAPVPTASTPPPPPSRTPSPSPPPSPKSLRAGATLSPGGEFSFGAGLTPIAVGRTGAAGNIFAFSENARRMTGGSEASSALSFLASQGKPATPAGATSACCVAFLAAPERPKTPTATGPTASGGFVFASPEHAQQPLTPTGSNTSGGLSFLASPKQPLTPTGSTASVGFFAPLTYEPSLTPTGSAAAAVASLLSPKAARTGSTDSTAFAFPSPGPACAHIGSPASAEAKETVPPAGLVTPSFVFSASRSPPPLRRSGAGSRKRPRPLLHIDATPRVRNLRKWEEEQQRQFTPPPQKVPKTDASATGEASRSSIMSASTGRPCCDFFATPPKAARQEAKTADSEASRSPAGSRCASPARPPSEKAGKPEREVEVSSAACSGAEVVVRVTCKCGVHRSFSFDHRP